MSKLLFDEPAIAVQPSLATRVGLNEAIFLQQLHYILVANDAVGKQADGRKWYRDKPRDFKIKYFPWWDEGVIKRTIANLRKDGLVLARHDLNKIKKDRSLWYSIDYDRLDRLDAPVERLRAKSAKRKAAREQAYSDSDYTKEQNVLLTNEAEIEAESTKEQNVLNGTEVQNDPLTEEQNVLLPKEQNVLTPKELHDLKTPIPKDSTSNEVGEPPPFSELPKKQQAQQMFSALAELVCLDDPTKDERGMLNQAEKRMRDKGYTPEDVWDFTEYWYDCDWRGLKKQHPTLKQVRTEWGAMLRWRQADDITHAAHATAERMAEPEPIAQLDPKQAAVEAFRRHAPAFGLSAPWLKTLEYHSTPNGHDVWTGSQMAVEFLNMPSRRRTVDLVCRAAGIERPRVVGE